MLGKGGKKEKGIMQEDKSSRTNPYETLWFFLGRIIQAVSEEGLMLDFNLLPGWFTSLPLACGLLEEVKGLVNTSSANPLRSNTKGKAVGMLGFRGNSGQALQIVIEIDPDQNLTGERLVARLKERLVDMPILHEVVLETNSR